MSPLRIVIFGLSLSSSWGNGHATTYRALIRALAERGHEILFLERVQPWYEQHCDLHDPSYCRLHFYREVSDLNSFASELANADAVIVGSFVPDGIEIGALVQATARNTTAFYDIDTPVTLAQLTGGTCTYLSRDLIPQYDIYFSFTGGPTLNRLERQFGSPHAEALYCSVDSDVYTPRLGPRQFDLGYLGTYSEDRQPTLERLLIQPARRLPDHSFIVAGAQFPNNIAWPSNVTRVDHVAPSDHPEFYGSLRYALNVTRADMIQAGYSPSVRLFEAAACGTPVISDDWSGLDTLFTPGKEILIARDAADVLTALSRQDDDAKRIGIAARNRVLASHTAGHRADSLEKAIVRARGRKRRHAETANTPAVPALQE